KFALGAPKISQLHLRFYSSESDLLAAYKKGTIESLNSIDAQAAEELQKSGSSMITSPLPRIFGVFFNQNHSPVLANKEVRQALDMAVDKKEKINPVFPGSGEQ